MDGRPSRLEPIRRAVGSIALFRRHRVLDCIRSANAP
jgi:hypothetical protein